MKASFYQQLRTQLAGRGWLVAIACAYLYVFPYFPDIHSANELPRVYLVKAIADDHTFAIDTGVKRWGTTGDVSESGGHSYSAKAPGSSLMVVPIYAAISAVAGEPSLAFTMWLCRVVTGIVPSLCFLWFLWGWLARYVPGDDLRRLLLLAYGLGSMALTYSILFISHQLSAICIGAAWMIAVDAIDGRRNTCAWISVGALAGCAPVVDYQAAFAGVPVAVYLIVRMVRSGWRLPRIARAFGIAAAAALPPIALFLYYNYACFGSPLRTGYDASQTYAHFHKVGFLGLKTFEWFRFVGTTVTLDNGVFSFAPWLALAFPGAWLLARNGDRATAILGIFVCALYLWFVASVEFWRGGWEVGPRYITVMLPFLLPLVGAVLVALRERPGWLGAACGLIIVSVIVYAGSAAVFPHFPEQFANPIFDVMFRLVGDGKAAPNAMTAIGAPDWVSLVPYALLVALVVGTAIRRVAGWHGTAVALAVAAVMLGGYSLAPRNAPGNETMYQWMRGTIP